MAARAAAIDVGGTTIKAGLVDADGRLSDRRQEPTPRDPEALVETVAALVADLPADAVGVVTPGIADERTGVVELSANLGWRDLPLRDMLTERLGRPVAFGHDVRAGALAESLWGVGEEDMLFVPLGTGIASALVLRGAVRGTGWAGEIGQLLVPDPDGGAGRAGGLTPGTGRVTLERAASAAAIAARYATRTGEPDTSGGARHVLDRAAAGDDVARDVVSTAVELLADVLASAVGLLGPVTIVLGGGLAQAGEVFLAPLRGALGARLAVMHAPDVRAATLGQWSGCLGAGALGLGLSPQEHP